MSRLLRYESPARHSNRTFRSSRTHHSGPKHCPNLNCRISSRTRRPHSIPNHHLRLMERQIPVTRENYLELAYIGEVLQELSAEQEADLPVELQRVR